MNAQLMLKPQLFFILECYVPLTKGEVNISQMQSKNTEWKNYVKIENKP